MHFRHGNSAGNSTTRQSSGLYYDNCSGRLKHPELRTNLNNVYNSAHSVAAHDGYAGAEHTTSEWNQLGRSNTADDGVKWSVNGGATYNTDPIVATGAFTIQFQVDLWSAGYGLHNYDQAKAWVDWDNDKKFANDNELKPTDPSYVANETILAGQYFKHNSDGRNDRYNYRAQDDQVVPDPYRFDYKILKNQYSDTMTTFTTDPFLVTDAMLDSLTLGGFEGFWLRARSQCNHVAFNQMDPYTGLYQGEAEDYLIKITDNRTPTPEPATMLLFGTGLAGLVTIRRKKKA